MTENQLIGYIKMRLEESKLEREWHLEEQDNLDCKIEIYEDLLSINSSKED